MLARVAQAGVRAEQAEQPSKCSSAASRRARGGRLRERRVGRQARGRSSPTSHGAPIAAAPDHHRLRARQRQHRARVLARCAQSPLTTTGTPTASTTSRDRRPIGAPVVELAARARVDASIIATPAASARTRQLARVEASPRPSRAAF